MKVIITILLSIIIGIGIALCCLSFDDKNNTSAPKNKYVNWMERLDENAKLGQIAVPGAHDAGTHKMLIWGETQSTSIEQMLLDGVRYFDIRVAKNGSSANITLENKSLVFFHGPLRGNAIYKEFVAIKKFIDNNPSEFLFLDFQHFDNGAEKETLAMIKSVLDPTAYALKTDKVVAQTSIGEVRLLNARYAIFWGGDATIEANDFIHIRENTLASPYQSELHYLGGEYLINDTFPHYFEYAKERPNQIFVLQSVLTAKDLMSNPNANEVALKPFINNFVESLSLSHNYLDGINVVMRDFVNQDLNNIELIINLNIYKKFLPRPNGYKWSIYYLPFPFVKA